MYDIHCTLYLRMNFIIEFRSEVGGAKLGMYEHIHVHARAKGPCTYICTITFVNNVTMILGYM